MPVVLKKNSPYTGKLNGERLQPRSNAKKRLGNLKKKKKISTINENAIVQHDMELSSIHTTEELYIDSKLNLRGDIRAIKEEVFSCHPAAASLKNIDLFIKRIDCVDRRTYDMKVYEADTIQRFRGHPNIVSMYSYWSENAANPYSYKNLVLLFQKVQEDEFYINDSLMPRLKNSSEKRILRFVCDISKALVALHNCRFIHCRVNPSNIMINDKGKAILGDLGRVELDAARHSHHLFSKLIINKTIPRVLMYWSPELLKMERYSASIDLWSFGISLYEIISGIKPFPNTDEDSFRSAVYDCRVDFDDLDLYPILKIIVTNLLKINPEDRWAAQTLLSFAQQNFASDIQKVWRGYAVRQTLKYKQSCTIAIQAIFRGYNLKRKFSDFRTSRRNFGATIIQSFFKMTLWRLKFIRIRKAFCRCQANVLCRLQRKRYLKVRMACLELQTLIRTYLDSQWYWKTRDSRFSMEKRCRDISGLLDSYQNKSSQFSECFPDGEIPFAMKYLESYESYESTMEEALLTSGEVYHPKKKSTALKKSEELCSSLQDEVERLSQELGVLLKEKEDKNSEKEKLKEALQDKYHDFEPMVERLKQRLAKLAKMCNDSTYLALSLARVYTYSAWDKEHEPNNLVNNVLRGDNSQWTTVSPSIDLALCEREECFISQVEIKFGELSPEHLFVYISSHNGDWMKHQVFSCKEPINGWQTYKLRGEPISRCIRLQMPTNYRGGNYVSVIQVRIKGIVQQKRAKISFQPSLSTSRSSHSLASKSMCERSFSSKSMTSIQGFSKERTKSKIFDRRTSPVPPASPKGMDSPRKPTPTSASENQKI